MASPLQRVKELIQAYEEFAATNPEDNSVESFVSWAKCSDDTNQQSNTIDVDPLVYLRDHNRLLLTVKRAVRPLVQASPFSGLDDYYLLLEVKETPGILKKELINRAGLEYSTGVEILARLKKRALIKEAFAPGDKRSRLVQLTAKGELAVDDFARQYNTEAQAVLESRMDQQD